MRTHLQVHSADFPLHWNMTKDLAIAFAIATVGIIGNVLLVPFIRPDLWFEWPELSTQPELKVNDDGVSTSGKVRLAPLCTHTGVCPALDLLGLVRAMCRACSSPQDDQPACMCADELCPRVKQYGT